MTPRFVLSAFGDEISDDLDIQLHTLVQLNIGFLELRGVWGKNVLELSDDEVEHIDRRCRLHGVAVSAIGSPIGKSSLLETPERELENLEHAFRIGSRLQVRLVRVFSFYPPEGTPGADYGSYVPTASDRLGELALRAKQEGFTLLLENEKGIVGDSIARCHGLLDSVRSAHLRFAWDPANFVQVGEASPTTDGWDLLGTYVAHVHVKDALATGQVMPAGQGDGQVDLLIRRLRDAGYSGYLALEPHLEIAGHSSGFSGVAGMTKAAGALRSLLSQVRCAESHSFP